MKSEANRRQMAMCSHLWLKTLHDKARICWVNQL